MDVIVKLDSVTQYNNMRGVATLHPLITVLDLSKAKPMSAQTFNFGLYAVYLKELFTRFFKQQVGSTPNEYRSSLN